MQGNQKLIIGIVVVLIIAVGGIYLFTTKKAQPSPVAQTGIEEEVVETLKPEEIGLDFFAKSDKKYVKFIINKPEGIEKVDYDILYDATSNGNIVSQGLTGEVAESEMGKSKIEINYRELGTCSTGGKCRFDEGVKKVTIVMRVLKSNGKTYQVEKSIDL